MIRTELVSSMMASAGYDPTTRVLEIEFVAGTVYHYLDVPPGVYQALLDAPSQGRYFHGRIRSAFLSRRVDEVSAQ